MDPLSPRLWQEIRPTVQVAYRGSVPRMGDGVVTAPAHLSCWTIESGAALVDAESRSWRAEPGQTLILPPHWRRRQRFARGSRIVSLGLTLDWASGAPLVPLSAPVLLRDTGLGASARAAVESLGAEGFVPFAERRLDAHGWLRWQECLGAFLVVLVRALAAAGHEPKAAGSGDARLDRTLAMLSQAPIGALPWAQLKSETGLSRTHLDRLCRGRLGMTPRALRDRELLRRAAALLADRERSVAGVAKALGFRDPSHFVKWHRRLAGLTPRAARLGEA
jgi:AraC family transcriptional activator of pobA